jgi:hypothetical protein
MRLSRLVILLVLVAIVLLPVSMALGQPINPVRVLPATVERGGTFNVTINFTGLADNFTGVSLNDIAPGGWNVTVSGAWCTPAALPTGVNNVVSVMWLAGPCHDDTHCNNTSFSAKYQVTVPCDASGNHTFSGVLYYYIWPDTTPYDEINETIGGDSQVQVIPPAICSTPSITFYSGPGQNPANETLELWSSTPCPLNPLNWSLDDDADYLGHDWLSESPTSGNCTNVHASVNLSVNTSGMPIGDYYANITINATDTLFSVEANNSPRVVPVSLHITDQGVLLGHVSFTGAVQGPKWVRGLNVRFFDNATQNETGWSSINVTTDAYGNFTIDDVQIGTYDIGIKNCTCLSEMVFGKVLTAGGATYVDFGTSREGDINEDDWVTAKDRGLLYDGWGTTNVIQDGYLCDLNRDGWLQAKDRGLMYDNWGQGGDVVLYLS